MILAASSDLFSAEHTGGILEPLLTWLLGSTRAEEWFGEVHYVVRKLAHLTEYGILAALAFRAFRCDRNGWTLRWTLQAVAFAIVVAGIDEWHQSHVPSRTGTPEDVVVDAIGATIAQLIVKWRTALRA